MPTTEPKKTVLVVDDAAENIDLLRAILAPLYALKVAINGEKALKIALSDAPPDLILLDIMMPGMDGYEVCRRIKAHATANGIPILFVTSMDDPQDQALGLSLGAADFIAKPFEPEDVVARVAAQLPPG